MGKKVSHANRFNRQFLLGGLALLGSLAACSSGTAGLKTSRQTGTFVGNHPVGCMVLAPFCPMLQAYTLLPEKAPPQPADPVWATAKAMEDCADKYGERKQAGELASCQNEAFTQWGQKGGMNAAALTAATEANSANAAQVASKAMPAEMARLSWNGLMERATLDSPPTAYTPNADVVPSSLLGWQQHECAARYGSVNRQLYVYQAMCDNAALMAWARRSHVPYEKIQPMMDGNLQISYQEQSQKLDREQAQMQRDALTKASGLDFSIPQNKNVFPGNAPKAATP
ncbi:hypothetical protein [Oecophyllibacter saccharovorans]|uniref:Lipoprotein n=1 Tax=Oecophyllibacter saccharovorans TaxID=2558360 RepID=A0A506UL44_9PROT|nr:hypothetical protein [Oecophyllibacter saccharovorans]TPW33883.1 hypothetical protein E3202_04640 [Oecophyllibacter saccharovorans]TPW35226.1 hypothetical protein E3203_07155 [Oecophyllibacter saccharovorans]